ncbi:MAG: segregation/condensation protein A [Clostridiales bacterium]|nr:segregation/condensation protein A [Clostridiales bacterium]
METPVYHLEGVVHTRSELENFDGPLDLILSLLSKNKMEIQDIQISLILDQYFAWMEQRKALDLDVASEFVTMASHLVYIKTRMLLSINDEEAQSEMEELIASLEARQRSEAYAKVQLVVPQLESRFEQGRNYITKQPESIAPDKTYRYQHKPEDLLNAMKRLYEAGAEPVRPAQEMLSGIVGREPYPVTEKAKEILDRLVLFSVTRFKALFLGSRSRSELVATFLAVLELCKSRKIRLAGTDDNCTVTVIHAEDLDDEWTELSADSY